MASAAGASGCRRALRRSLQAWLSRGFCLRLVAPAPTARPRSAVHYILDFSSVEPVPFSVWDAPRLPLLLSLLQRCFRSTAGATILYLPSRSDVGVLPSISPGSRLVRLSVYYLTNPSLAGTQRSGASDRSSPVCLHLDPHREQQSFSYAIDSFIGNDRFTPSPLIRSSDNFPYPSRYSRP